MTRSDYQMLVAVAVALLVALVLNAVFAVSVVPRARGAGPPAPASGGIGEETVAAINAYRATLGKPALRYDSRLAGAADFHNRWMRDHDCWAHQCPGEPDPWQRIKAAGYSYTTASEVIGRGYGDAASAVSGWRNSPPHNAIITGDYADAGCAMLAATQIGNGPWWTCDFGTGGVPYQPTPAPLPTATPWWGAPTVVPSPTARAGLPVGQLMEVTGRFGVFGLPRPSGCPALAGTDCLLTLQVDYGLSNWAVTDYLYYTYCLRPDVTCRWPWKGR